MTRWVLVHVQGGLGNRMRTLLGAEQLAEEEGRQLAFVWPRGAEFQPKVTDLWNFDAREVPALTSLAARLVHRPIYEFIPDDERRRRMRLLYVNSPARLKRPGGEMICAEDRLQRLTPAPVIAEQVRATWPPLAGRPYVGVSIRAHPTRTHARTLLESPVSWYLRRMAEVRTADPEVLFFLSCDWPEAEVQVRQQFAGVHSIREKGSYNSIQGVQSAVADLYLMAASGWVMAPHWSSFATLAQGLAGGLPLETATDPLAALPDLGRREAVVDPLRPWERC